MSAEMTQIEFFVARYIFSGEHTFGFGRGCLHEQARQIRYIVLSPTTRRSILLIRSERSTSAALMAAIVCRNVLTFDPSDTIPPSTTAIDPMAEHYDEQQCDATGDCHLGNLSASLGDLGKLLEPRFDP